MNLLEHETWSKMCGTTPNSINGVFFSTPTHCEDRVCHSVFVIWFRLFMRFTSIGILGWDGGDI